MNLNRERKENKLKAATKAASNNQNDVALYCIDLCKQMIKQMICGTEF